MKRSVIFFALAMAFMYKGHCQAISKAGAAAMDTSFYKPFFWKKGNVSDQGLWPKYGRWYTPVNNSSTGNGARAREVRKEEQPRK